MGFCKRCNEKFNKVSQHSHICPPCRIKREMEIKSMKGMNMVKARRRWVKEQKQLVILNQIVEARLKAKSI